MARAPAGGRRGAARGPSLLHPSALPVALPCSGCRPTSFTGRPLLCFAREREEESTVLILDRSRAIYGEGRGRSHVQLAGTRAASPGTACRSSDDRETKAPYCSCPSCRESILGPPNQPDIDGGHVDYMEDDDDLPLRRHGDTLGARVLTIIHKYITKILLKVLMLTFILPGSNKDSSHIIS
uniref:Uncharacterized protein n=1 Tax=Oryza sativa subsp. japonica TaxID=39947 RepID=Q6ZA44_ORYSJ|nr:hypothetical protein [Oryza sativa Japonica Group]